MKSTKHVLRTNINSLLYPLRWIVRLPERLQQESGADFFVGLVGCEAAGVANRGSADTAKVPEEALDTPKAAMPKI